MDMHDMEANFLSLEGEMKILREGSFGREEPILVEGELAVIAAATRRLTTLLKQVAEFPVAWVPNPWRVERLPKEIVDRSKKLEEDFEWLWRRTWKLPTLQRLLQDSGYTAELMNASGLYYQKIHAAEALRPPPDRTAPVNRVEPAVGGPTIRARVRAASRVHTIVGSRTQDGYNLRSANSNPGDAASNGIRKSARIAARHPNAQKDASGRKGKGKDGAQKRVATA